MKLSLTGSVTLIAIRQSSKVHDQSLTYVLGLELLCCLNTVCLDAYAKEPQAKIPKEEEATATYL